MKVNGILVLLPFIIPSSSQDEQTDKEAKAVIVENDSVAEKRNPEAKLFTANPAINGAVVGVGVGVLGSLLVGALLNEKKNCNPGRGRRDTPSARFLPGLTGKKCPPSNYGYPNSAGYQQPTPSYPIHGTGYQQPTNGYHQPINGYSPPSNIYNQPSVAYQQPTSGYRQPGTGYSPINNGYGKPQQLVPGYNSNQGSVSSGYQAQNSGYRPPGNNAYQPTNFPPTPGYTGVPAPLPVGYPGYAGRSVNQSGAKLFQAGIQSNQKKSKSGAVKFEAN